MKDEEDILVPKTATFKFCVEPSELWKSLW